jgi:PhzF family phenazine biosynthesis protein
MATVSISIVDVFTRTPQAGNPACVVFDADGLSDAAMQAIAREFNLSETAFLVAPADDAADVRLRWFSPTMEITICGHSTIACFHRLAEENLMEMTKEGTYSFRVETASGILPVTVRKEGVPRVEVGLPLAPLEKISGLKVDLMRILRINSSDIVNGFPVEGAKCLYVQIKRLHTLVIMRPNLFLLSQFLSTRTFDGLCVFTTETVDRESAAHCRFFAPHQGIPEDPATASACASLALLLYQSGALKSKDPARFAFQVEQGDSLERPSRISVELTVANGVPAAVTISGQAVTVLKGDMQIPD